MLDNGTITRISDKYTLNIHKFCGIYLSVYPLLSLFTINNLLNSAIQYEEIIFILRE